MIKMTVDLKDLDEEKLLEELYDILPFGEAAKRCPNLYRLFLRLTASLPHDVVKRIKREKSRRYEFIKISSR